MTCTWPMRWAPAPVGPLLALVGVVLAANFATTQLGLVTWLGLTATAGTWLAGLAFVARDALHEAGGRWWVLAGIGAGATLSAALSPQLAIASCVAFTVAELADYAVYAPLRRRGRTRAALASNMVGSIVDTVLFLLLAGFPLSGTATQVAVKVGTTSAVVIGGACLALLRQPLHPRSRRGHA